MGIHYLAQGTSSVAAESNPTPATSTGPGAPRLTSIVAPPLVDSQVRDQIQRRQHVAPAVWSDLLLGKRSSLAIPEHTPKVLFPGAFNPLHSGHEQMAELAAARCGAPVTFELSIINVDKPPLDFIELNDRLQQLAGRNVLVTRAPTFAEKAPMAPGCVFVAGLDTVARIGMPEYYNHDASLRDAALAAVAAAGCRFLVFPRLYDGKFRTLAEAELPPALRALCDEVPESAFRADVSSTQLREV